MMFLDASAMIAIVAGESDAASLAARLGQAARVSTSPIAVYEAVLGLARIGNTSIADATSVVDRFLAEVDAVIVPIDPSCGREAIAAFDRFGRGRHAAALNLGDCFAYACARVLDVPLLCKGDDFPRTDIAIA
jgi:ribonuclease VapC